MQYETCRHVHPDGAYCGSPALTDRKYCHYHLRDRGRRLTRARALRDNIPYRLEIPALLDVESVLFALTEISQALASGLLDHRVAGKMLYAIQQATSLIKYRAKLQVEQLETVSNVKDPVGGPQLPSVGNCAAEANPGANPGPTSHIQEYPTFERDFGLDPGADTDAETVWTLRKADEQAELRHPNEMPAPPPGMRAGSAQFKVYREEAYQFLNMRLNQMQHNLNEYYAMKRKESEESLREAGYPTQKKKAPASATPASDLQVTKAG